MPTVIDSLLIELGLDATKFDAAQKKSIEQLRKFDEQQQKTSKRTQEDAQKTTQGFNKATQSVADYFLAYAGVSQVKDFVENQTKNNTQLARSSSLLNISARELKTWGQVAEVTGSNVEEMTGTLLGLQESLAQIKRGNGAFLEPMALLGATEAFDINKSTFDLYKLADAIKKFEENRPNDRALALSYAKSLGVSEKQFLLFEQGSEAVKKQYHTFDILNQKVQDNTESAAALNKEWIKTKAEASSLGDVIYDRLLTPINLVNKGLQYSAKGFKALFSLSLDPFRESAQQQFEDKVAKKAGTYSSGVSPTGNVPRNMRNFNPGNIEYGEKARKLGAIGSDGRFAIFPNMQTGNDAMATLLMEYVQGGNNTISKIINKWSPAAENGASNTNAYIADVAKQTGIDPNKSLNMMQLTAIQQAMAQHEGMVGSKVNAPNGTRHLNNSSEINIENMNISTQATDAAGLAKDLPRHLKNNSLIGSGIGAF
jgi:hypothetical protein